MLVRILLVPVTVKQIHSMQNLQAHAPEMKAIQQKWKHDKQRQNEELMKFYRENKINPAASCLPIVLQIPIFISLFYVLRHFDETLLPLYGGSVDWLHLVDITEPVKDGWGPLLLVIYVASQLSSSYFMSTTMQGAQRILLMVLPVLFVPFILNFPAGLMLYWLTTNLWTTGQGLVTRRLMPKPAAAREAELAHAGEGRAGRGERQRRAGRRRQGGRARPQARRRPAAAGEAQEGRRRDEAMTERSPSRRRARRSARRSGAPSASSSGGCRASTATPIRFQVVSEGERGLLGVGYTPASVVATVDVPERSPLGGGRTPTPTRPSQAALVRELLERTIAASGVPATVRIDESGEELVATLVGADLGVLIGRHGQTIDALQYLANAIGHRSQGEDRPARGRRRRRLPRPPRRHARDAWPAAPPSRPPPPGRRVELEPMTAVERRIVHELLKDDPEVETSSEGSRADPVRRRPPAPLRGLTEPRVASRRPRPLARGGRRDAGADGDPRSRDRPRGAARRRPPRGRARRRRRTGRSSTSARAAARPGSRSRWRCPTAPVTLLEAERRKCRFLETWAAELPNVSVVWGRAEEQEPGAVRRRAWRRRSPTRRPRPSGACRSCGRAGSSSSGSARRPSRSGSPPWPGGSAARSSPLPRACSRSARPARRRPGFPRRTGVAKKRPLA